MTKKIFSICFFLLALLNIAVSQESKVNYGFSASFTSPAYQVYSVNSGITRSASSTFNGQLAGWARLSTSKYFGVEGGLALTGLGTKWTHSEFGSRDVTQHTYWLQVPVNLVFKFPIEDVGNLFFKVGGYAGVGLFGTNYGLGSYSGNSDTKFSFGDDGTQKGSDYGWNMNFGYKFKSGYLINLGYQQGLKDLSTTSQYKQKNRAWTFGVGYEF